jgi:malate dehydrogenase (oxaloacetate-decarboxylating)(NADP+)
MHLLLRLGASKNNIYVVDSSGVIHSGRTKLNPYKFGFAIETDKRTLTDAMDGADVFIRDSKSLQLCYHPGAENIITNCPN